LPRIRAPDPRVWWLNDFRFDKKALRDWDISSDFCGQWEIINDDVIGDDFEVVFDAAENSG
jgi:hypothetical protein